LIQPVPDRAQLAERRRRLQVGDTVDPDELAAWLIDHGFRRTDAVELPGEFSRRGGILDVYSADAEAPTRLEFFGEEIESIRQFSAQTQRSLGNLQTTDILAAGELGAAPASNGKPPLSRLTGHVADYLPADGWTALIDPDELQEQGKHFLER